MMWSLYRFDTGRFTGVVVSDQKPHHISQLEAAGIGLMPGSKDHLCECVDVGAAPPDPRPDDWYPPVIPYQPTAPADTALETWSWDAAIRRWVAAKTLAWHKLQKWAEIRGAATAAGEADITLQGVTFAADAATFAALLQEGLLAQMAVADDLSYSLEWERANGNAITLTAVQLKGLIRGINTRTVQIRAAARALKAQIEAAADKAALDAIVWTG